MAIAIDLRGLTSKQPTGVGTYVYSLVEEYLSNHEDVILWYSGRKRINWMHELWGSRATVLHLRVPNKLFNVLLILFRYPKLDKLVAKESGKQIDTIVAPNMNTYALSNDVNFILTIHDLAFYLFPWYYSWKGRLWHKFVHIQKLAARAEKIVVPSQSTAWDVEDWLHISPERIDIAPPALPSQYTDKANWNEHMQELVHSKYQIHGPYFLYIGTIEPRKNLETLLAAYVKMREGYPRVQLVIAGPRGWKCKKLMKQIMNTSGVQYLGYIDEEDMPAVYAGAIAFVYPSFYEGYGFPVLEAQAVGTQVITSSRSSLLEVANEKAIIIDPYNVTDLADAMKECCRS